MEYIEILRIIMFQLLWNSAGRIIVEKYFLLLFSSRNFIWNWNIKYTCFEMRWNDCGRFPRVYHARKYKRAIMGRKLHLPRSTNTKLHLVLEYSEYRVSESVSWELLQSASGPVVVVVVVRWQQGKNGKEAREETEGKSGRVHRGR